MVADTKCSEEDMENVATTRPSAQHNRFAHTSCTRCGAIKGQCPVSGGRCLKCLKMSPFRKCCKAKVANRKDIAVVMVDIIATVSHQLSSHLQLDVKLARGTHGVSHADELAMGDTGAMVCFSYILLN